MDKGYTLEQAGLVMGAFGTGAILGGLIGGYLTDKFGHFPVQVSSLMLNGILFIILGQMQTLPQITICIFILSTLGEAFRPANSAAIAAFSDDSSRTRSYSLNRLAINLGWGIGPAVGGLLANKSYTLLFWADGITCIIAAMVLYFIFLPYKTSHGVKAKDKTVEPSRSAYRDSIFLTGMLCIFLVGLCFFQMFSIIPVYYKNELHFSKATTGFILALNGLIIAVTEMVLVYKLEKRGHPTHYLVLGAMMIGSSFLVLNISSVLLLALISMVIVTFGEMFLFPFMNHFWVNRSTERNRGQYAALYTMSFSLAITLAPSYAALVQKSWGFPVLWICNFLLCTLAAGGFLSLKKRMNT